MGGAHHSLDLVFIAALLQSLLQLVLRRSVGSIVLVHLVVISVSSPKLTAPPDAPYHAVCILEKCRHLARVGGLLSGGIGQVSSGNGCGFGGGRQPAIPLLARYKWDATCIDRGLGTENYSCVCFGAATAWQTV